MRAWAAFKFWAPVVVGGALCGLLLGWAEERFAWAPGSGRRILLGIMVVAGVVSVYAFYRMIRAEVEEEP